MLNLIDIQMVPYVKENKIILDISLDMCIILSDIATVNRIQCIHHVHCLTSDDAPHDALTWFCQ